MILEQLSVASFKGVRFACNSTTTTVGRAKIKHEFANSDRNNIEDQGLLPRTYVLTARIFGANYQRDRDQLLAAIEDSEPGVLIHPFYGRIENAVAMPITYDETVRKLGVIEIPITFEISDSDGIPAVAQLSSSGILNLKNLLISSVITDLANTFNVTTSFTGNFNAAQDKLASFAATITDSVTLTGVAEQAASSFRAKLDLFNRNINELVTAPDQMAQSVTGIINDISGLYNTAEQTLLVARQLFDFGDSDTIINGTTAGLAERLVNNTALNEAIKSTALGVSYESAALINFKTVTAVDETSRALEQVYRGLKG